MKVTVHERLESEVVGTALPRSGRVVEATWPRSGLVVGPARR